MGDAFPTFSPTGTMLGNLTSSQGQIPAPEISGSTLGQGISGTTVTTPGAAATPATSATNPAANASATAAANPTSGPVAGSIADYFARAIIIILGFIFIAVGLNMLRPGTVPVPGRLRP